MNFLVRLLIALFLIMHENCFSAQESYFDGLQIAIKKVLPLLTDELTSTRTPKEAKTFAKNVALIEQRVCSTITAGRFHKVYGPMITRGIKLLNSYPEAVIPSDHPHKDWVLITAKKTTALCAALIHEPTAAFDYVEKLKPAEEGQCFYLKEPFIQATQKLITSSNYPSFKEINKWLIDPKGSFLDDYLWTQAEIDTWRRRLLPLNPYPHQPQQGPAPYQNGGGNQYSAPPRPAQGYPQQGPALYQNGGGNQYSAPPRPAQGYPQPNQLYGSPQSNAALHSNSSGAFADTPNHRTTPTSHNMPAPSMNAPLQDHFYKLSLSSTPYDGTSISSPQKTTLNPQVTMPLPSSYAPSQPSSESVSTYSTDFNGASARPSTRLLELRARKAKIIKDFFNEPPAVAPQSALYTAAKAYPNATHGIHRVRDLQYGPRQLLQQKIDDMAQDTSREAHQLHQALQHIGERPYINPDDPNNSAYVMLMESIALLACAHKQGMQFDLNSTPKTSTAYRALLKEATTYVPQEEQKDINSIMLLLPYTSDSTNRAIDTLVSLFPIIS